MEKLNEFSIEDILFSIAFEHLARFKELREHLNTPEYAHMQNELRKRLEAEVILYNIDIEEVYEIANKILDKEEFTRVADSVREVFNIYCLPIFT